MTWRISRNGQLKKKMYINTEKTKALLITGKRFQHQLSAETATLQLLFNATNIEQIRITSYWV